LVRAAVSSTSTGTIQNTATVTSPTFDPNTSNNNSSASTLVEASADLSVVKTATPKSVVAGESISYNIVVSNAGPSDAVNVVLSDVIPSGLKNVQYSTDGGATWNAFDGTYNIASLAAGSSVSISLKAAVDPAAVGSVVNSVTVRSDTADPNPDNNSFSVVTPVRTSADVAVKKSADKNPVPAGEALTYTLIVTNNGPSDAQNVNIADTPPALIENAVYSTDNGATWSAWGGSHLLNTLGKGQTVTILIRGTVSATATGGVLSNTVTVTGDTPDPELSNNEDTVNVPINASADLSVTKSVTPAFAKHGQAVAYTVTVSNAGPNIASMVVLKDLLPSSLLNGQYSLNGGTTWNDVMSANYTYTAESLGVGESFTVLLRGTVNQTAEGIVTNNATVSSDTPDPDTLNNNDSANFVVGDAANLKVTKTADKASVVAGERLTYTIAIQNSGPDDAESVVLNDRVPDVLLNPEFSADGGTTWQEWTNPYAAGTVASGTTKNILLRGTIDPSANAALVKSITNTANASSDTPDPDASDNTSSVTVPITISADLSVTKTGTPSPVVAGGTVTFNLDILNKGPSNAEGVLLVDAVPANILRPEYSTDGGIMWLPWVSPMTLGTLTPGAGQNIQIRGVVDAAATGAITNTAVVTGSTPDPNNENNTSETEIPIQSNADISVVKTAGADKVMVGDLLTYTLTISNAGPSYAENVVLSDITPAELNNPEFSTDGGLNWAPWTGSLEIGTMSVGASLDVQIRGTVKSTAGATISNTASVSGTTPDPNDGNNQSTAPVEAGAVCPAGSDLSVEKCACKKAVRPCGAVRYTLNIKNAGAGEAQNAVLIDTLSEKFSAAVYSVDEGATWSDWNGWVGLGNIAPKASVTVQIVAKVHRNAKGVITNNAFVFSQSADTDLKNNVATVRCRII
jgi:uncharacterized repeat protein (TIGR01451 family)